MAKRGTLADSMSGALGAVAGPDGANAPKAKATPPRKRKAARRGPGKPSPASSSRPKLGGPAMPTTYKLTADHADALREVADTVAAARARAHGKPRPGRSDASEVLRAILDAWIADGCPTPEGVEP